MVKRNLIQPLIRIKSFSQRNAKAAYYDPLLIRHLAPQYVNLFQKTLENVSPYHCYFRLCKIFTTQLGFICSIHRSFHSCRYSIFIVCCNYVVPNIFASFVILLCI